MDQNEFQIRAGSKLATSFLVGIGAAGSMGIAPTVGAAMATTAFLSSCVVVEALNALPQYEEDNTTMQQFVGTLTLMASWTVSATQIAQIFAKTVMFTAVPFYPSLFIVSSALIIGSAIFGELLANQIVGHAVERD